MRFHSLPYLNKNNLTNTTMTYAQIKAQHNAGIPPNTDFQRPTETFQAYFDRMHAAGFPPDINAGESDADYLIRLATYVVPPKFENISASWAQYAATETGVQITAQTASYVKGNNVSGAVTSSLTATSATTAATASYVKSSSISGKVPTAVTADTASYVGFKVPTATTADTASYFDATIGSVENATSASYFTGSIIKVTSDTGTCIAAETRNGFCINALATYGGYGLYAESLLTEAVAGAQKGILTGNVNRAAVSAYRQVTLDAGYDTFDAVLNVCDKDLTGSGPLIVAKMFDPTPGYGTEVFKVDKTGSVSLSGSLFADGDHSGIYIKDVDGTMRKLTISASTVVIA